MKWSSLLMSALFLVGMVGLSVAQDATPADSSTPVAQPAMKAGVKHPRIKEIRGRLQEQMKRIQEGVASKKLTQDEAKDLRSKVAAVRDQMKADIQQNNKTELTEEQYTQLNQMLDDNSKAIAGEKQAGADTTTAGSALDAASTPETSSTPAPAAN
jgi:predicted RNase H-like nuclease (RuvC/YqgF family)